MEGIQGLWSLKEDSLSLYDKYLITSFISETHVLAMTEEGLEETEMLGLNSLIRSHSKFVRYRWGNKKFVTVVVSVTFPILLPRLNWVTNLLCLVDQKKPHTL